MKHGKGSENRKVICSPAIKKKYQRVGSCIVWTWEDAKNFCRWKWSGTFQEEVIAHVKASSVKTGRDIGNIAVLKMVRDSLVFILLLCLVT